MNNNLIGKDSDRYADLIARLGSATTAEGLRAVLHETVAGLGFRSFAYHVVKIAGVGDALIHGVHTYPDEWVERYEKERYVVSDPVVKAALNGFLPFRWSSLDSPEQLNPVQARLFMEADDFKIRKGFSVPIHGRQEFALFSVVPELDGMAGERTIDEHRHLLHLMSLYFHDTARKILVEEEVQKTRPKLTLRERECLQWTAVGKSTWDISAILGISERTVVYHLENAKIKLDVFNRSHAVVKAIMTGLIELPA